MRRREFITLLGGAATAWPVAARGQQRVRRIGVVMGYAESDPEAQRRIKSFQQGLAEGGWNDGRNVQIEYRWASANVEQIAAFAKEIVALRPDVILSNTTPVTKALQRETHTIPIVFVIVSDPVGDGLVTSLARPGGNITGFINFEEAMSGKWLELLKEIAPRVARTAIMFNPNTAAGGGKYFQPAFDSAGALLKVAASPAPVRSLADIENAIAALAREPDGGLVVSTDSFLTVNRALIMSLVERHKVPTVWPLGTFSKEGGLIGYGPDYLDLFRRSGLYVGRILQGAKPEDLPVQVPAKFELVVNLKTAKLLGLDVPWILQQRADEVIE
jgi:putative ABC transport system substrate-binding protein